MTYDEFLSRLSGVKRTGSGATAKCPAHQDAHASLSISTSDDGRILLHCHAGCTTEAVVEAMGLELKDLYPSSPKKSKSTCGKIVAIYDYVDAEGVLSYQVVRTEPKGFRQRRPDPEKPGEWIWDLRGVKPLLYHLPEVISRARAGRPLVIVEGEKDVDTLRSIGISATCNSGGAGKFPRQAVEWLQGARIAIIPDSDVPGRKHADQVALLLHGAASEIRIVLLPEGSKDVSDFIAAGGTKEQLITLLRAAPLWNPEKTSTQETVATDFMTKAPFLCLGHDHDERFYFSRGQRCVISLRMGEHVPTHLQSLAPISWWENHFQGRQGVDWYAARDALYQTGNRIGSFDRDRLRGCGVWFDSGHTVLHRGDHLVVDGQHIEINDYKSRYIYEGTFPAEDLDCPPLSLDDTKQLLELTELFTWAKPVYAYMFLGWCAIAPICGALPWRPHVWLTGPSNCGKTWILGNVLVPLMGRAVVCSKGATTEAGIRQKLRMNAWPVLFDESEGEERTAQARLQGVIELARQASSESEGSVLKGTRGGNAESHIIRSVFAFSSTNTQLYQKSDQSRISLLELLKLDTETAESVFEKIQHQAEFITPEWCAGFRARAIAMIPTILKNYETFRHAASIVFGDTRIGVQLGSLFAGAHTFISDDLVTFEDAKNLIIEQNWEGNSTIETIQDEQRVFDTIIQSIIQVNDDGRRQDRTIGELISIIYRSETTGMVPDELDIDEAQNTLFRHGIKVKKNEIFISESNKEIKKLLRDTPWEKNWKHSLGRLEGADHKKCVRFGSMSATRATVIPISHILKGDNE